MLVQENWPHLEEREGLSVLIEQNVVAQLASLRTHPLVAARVHNGQLTLRGRVYDIESGAVACVGPGA